MPPRIFISYSHDTNAHVERVLSLADRLRDEGLDVRLDQYLDNPPEGWTRWMQRQLEEADFVVFICSATYRTRFDGKAAPGTGQGATWEGFLATQLLYDANSLNTRFLPAYFDDSTVDDIPLPLRPATRYRLPDGYDDLYRRLTGQPKTPPPPIGAIRTMPPASRPRLTATPSSSGHPSRNQGATVGQQDNVTGGTTSRTPTTVVLRPSPLGILKYLYRRYRECPWDPGITCITPDMHERKEWHDAVTELLVRELAVQVAPSADSHLIQITARGRQHIELAGIDVDAPLESPEDVRKFGDLLATPVARSPTPTPAEIRLFTANAADPYRQLAIDNELRVINDALQRARLRERYDLRISPAITFAQLIHDLDDHAPRFVHFSGHGDATGALILKTADFQDATVTVEHLRELFAEQRVRPELVVFATCYSRDLAAAVAPHVGHAIGFTGPLADPAAQIFSAVLYERLAAHDPPDIRRAFRLARLAAVSAGFPEIEQACLFDAAGAVV